MRAWTYSEIKDKVQKDLDLQDEGFIQTPELMEYCNEAIDEAEAEIHKLHEDYFLTSTSFTWVAGTADYAMPTDIYSNKIRAIIYKSGTDIYEIKRVRGEKKFLDITDTNNFGTNDEYRYFIKNASASAGVKVSFVPAPRDSGSLATVWYIRNANRITQNSDTLDIPEFANFVIQFMKVRCYEKEMHPNLQVAIQILQQQRKMMVDTLTEMVVDDDTEVPMDLSHYWEHT